MYHGKIISSTNIPPRVGYIVCALSTCGDWFNIKVIRIYNGGTVQARVIPSDLERYRDRLNRPGHSGTWHKKLKYRHDPNDIGFYKR